ncbi:MAG: thiamine phosphate synthase [Alphaproteobacteria bacterium]|nr:thiamine phosphate synthase [Alphaproteobacteria bacterium]
MRARAHACLPGLFLMTDADRMRDPLPVLETLAAGTGVILRHYEWPRAQRESLARAVAIRCASRRLRLFIAADPYLAQRVGAFGCHLPERLGGKLPAWRRLFPRLRWTIAAHGEKSMIRARTSAPDAIILSPVFTTRSHKSARTLGVLRFEAWARRSSVPVIALGGITGHTARRLAGSHAAGLAAISGLSVNG